MSRCYLGNSTAKALQPPIGKESVEQQEKANKSDLIKRSAATVHDLHAHTEANDADA